MAKKAAAARSTKKAADDEWELLGGEGGSEMEVGEVVTGVYGGIVRSLPSKQRGKPPIPFYQVGDRALLGGAVLKARIEEGQILPGDELEVTRLDDGVAKKGQSAPKIYKVRVRRVVSQKPDRSGATAPNSKRKRV